MADIKSLMKTLEDEVQEVIKQIDGDRMMVDFQFNIPRVIGHEVLRPQDVREEIRVLRSEKRFKQLDSWMTNSKIIMMGDKNKLLIYDLGIKSYQLQIVKL